MRFSECIAGTLPHYLKRDCIFKQLNFSKSCLFSFNTTTKTYDCLSLGDKVTDWLHIFTFSMYCKCSPPLKGPVSRWWRPVPEPLSLLLFQDAGRNKSCLVSQVGKEETHCSQANENTNHRTKIMNAKYIKMRLVYSICMHFNMHLSFPLLTSVGADNIKQLSAVNN